MGGVTIEEMVFVDLGRIGFHEALQKQEQTVGSIFEGRSPETVYVLEHPHIFTVGRAGNSGNLLAERDWEGNPIELVRINRGGDVTYHGPGQLVGYPHLDLRKRGRDVHAYLRGLEESLIRTAAHFGVAAFRRPGLTGVWTTQGKLASIGIGVRQWITMHGFALNLSTDLRYFQLIHPCGMEDCPMTSLDVLTETQIDPAAVKAAFRQAFPAVFSWWLEPLETASRVAATGEWESNRCRS